MLSLHALEMSSRALLLPHVRPRRVGSVTTVPRIRGRRRTVEVYQTPCIVLSGNLDGCDTLINPSNPGLTGASNFPYFPRGGPVPGDDRRASLQEVHHIMGYVSRWGDVDVSRGLLLPENVIDGLVHQYAGWRLRLECWAKRLESSLAWPGSREQPCPVGSAVVTSAGDLRPIYQQIVHTTPPFFLSTSDGSTKNAYHAKKQLMQCYHNAWKLGLSCSRTARLATPLLGAGCRGFPLNVALSVAVNASTEWLIADPSEEKLADDDQAISQQTVVFGLLEEDAANKLLCDLLNRVDEKG